MAKKKRYMVEVEVTVNLSLFVEARRPGGAEAQVLTPEGWREALRYEDDYDLRWVNLDKDVKVVRVKEM